MLGLPSYVTEGSCLELTEARTLAGLANHGRQESVRVRIDVGNRDNDILSNLRRIHRERNANGKLTEGERRNATRSSELAVLTNLQVVNDEETAKSRLDNDARRLEENLRTLRNDGTGASGNVRH